MIWLLYNMPFKTSHPPKHDCCTKCINIFAWAPILSEHEACQSFDLPDNQNGRRKHSTYPALPLINETTGVNTSGIYHLYIIYNILC